MVKPSGPVALRRPVVMVAVKGSDVTVPAPHCSTVVWSAVNSARPVAIVRAAYRPGRPPVITSAPARAAVRWAVQPGPGE